jgi:hypothetical protein
MDAEIVGLVEKDEFLSEESEPPLEKPILEEALLKEPIKEEKQDEKKVFRFRFKGRKT